MPRLSRTSWWWLAPIAIAVHAVFFWGRGVIDKEGVAFTANYLSDRPLLAMVFDPRVNDFGTYQARELSYFFDYLNVRVLALLRSFGWFVLVPATGILGLAAVVGVYIGATRQLRGLDTPVRALVLAWLLSTVVVQASVAVFYRSAKMLLLVSLLAFVYVLSGALRAKASTSRWRLAAIFGLGLAMSLVDRQGLFFLLLLSGLTMLWIAGTPTVQRPSWRVTAPALGVVLAAAAVGELYNFVIGPWIIEQLNGYRPDFSYQQLEIRAAVTDARFWSLGARMMSRQAEFLTAGLPLLLVVAVAAIFHTRQLLASVARPTTREIVRDIGVALAAALGLVLLAALMILRHPFVFTIPDHAYWYFFLPVHGLVAAGVTLWLSRLAGAAGTLRWRAAWLICLGALTIGNLWRLPSLRHDMLASEYFAAESGKSRQMIEGHDRITRGEDPPDIPRWISAGGDGVVLRLPVPRTQFFPDTLATIVLARSRHASGDAARGTQWLALREFFTSDGSPLNDLSQMPALLDGWRQIGVRELHVCLDKYDDRAAGERVVDAIRAAGGGITGERTGGATTIFSLAPAAGTDRPASAGGRPVPPASMTMTASQSLDRLPLLVDGDYDTRWLTGAAQSGGEWIRVTFDRPRDVGRLRLDLARRSYGDYPRRLAVDAERGGVRVTLFEGSALAPLVAGILRHPGRAPIEIDLPPNVAESIVIRQTGQTRVWYWSVHELAVWER